MRILTLLLFLSTVTFGQNKGLWKKYIDIPAAPAQSSPLTIVPGDFCAGAGVFCPPASHEAKTSGNFTSGFSLRQWDGTVGSPYTLVNTAGDIYGGAGGAQEGVSITNSSNYYYLYGLSAAAPMIVKGNNGIQVKDGTSASGGTHVIIRNVVGKQPKAAGITANFPVSSGSYYAVEDYQFFRYFGTGVDATSQEGICYIGRTDPSGDYAPHGTVILKHNFSYNSAREGVQLEHITLVTATHNTCVLSGQGGVGSQTNSLQAHDLGPGSVIADNIFDGSPDAANVFTHGTTFRNNYFGFSVNGVFMGRTDNSYFSTSPRLTGDSVIYDGNDFNYTGAGTLAYVINVTERVAPVMIRNNTFSTNITAAYVDNRVAGYTNTITGTIGTKGNVSAAITAPIYLTGYNDQDNYAVQGLINTISPHYAKHRGYRDP